MGVGSWLALQSFGLVSAGKRNLAHELNGKKINKSKRIKGCKETKWLFFSSWYQLAGCGPEHMARERVHFSGEREREFQEDSRARGEVKRGIFKRAVRERFQGGVLVFKLGFLTPPNGCLDQLGPMLERLLLCCSTQSIN